MLSFRQTTTQSKSRRNQSVMRPFVRSTAFVCSLLASGCLAGYGQSVSSEPSELSTETPAPVQPSSESSSSRANADLGNVGAAVKVSLLGVGGEVAVSVTHHTNLRAGFNMISYSRGFDQDGISYAGKLDFKTFEAHTTFSRGPRASTSALACWYMQATRSRRRLQSPAARASVWAASRTRATPRTRSRVRERLTSTALHR